ncbi:MAG: translocation/assembly module TamB domain-containing protein [Candidatus Aminicenantes bacterium]|nr:translocation/assembly module TamB domain-containing protein [Candidatus Aminicenantes bacterium]
MDPSLLGAAGAAFPLEGAIEFGLSKEGIEISRADFKAAGAELSFSGRLGRDRVIRARFRAFFDNLAETARYAGMLGAPASLPAIGGRARLEGRMEGALPRPSVRAERVAERISLKALFVDSAEAVLSLDPFADATPPRRRGLKSEPRLSRRGREERLRVNPEQAPAFMPGSRGVDRVAVEISRFKAKIGEGTVEASGRLFLNNPGRPSGRISLTLAGLPIEAFSSFLPEKFGTGFGGALDAGVEVSGRLDRPRLDFRIKASPLQVRGLRLSSVSASGRFEAGGPVAVDEFRIVSDGGTIEGGLSLDSGRREFSVKAWTSGIDLAVLHPFFPGQAPSGRIVFKLEGGGPFEKPVGTFRLDAERVKTTAFSIPGIGLKLESDGTAARAVLTSADPGVLIEAEVPLRKPHIVSGRLKTERIVLDRILRPEKGEASAGAPAFVAEGTFSLPLEDLDGFTARLSFSGFDLGSLAAFSGGKIPPGLGGEIGGWLDLVGNPGSFDRIKAEGEIGRLRISYDRFFLENKGPIRLGFRDGAFELKELRLANADSEIRASGAIRGLPARPEIEGRVSLDIDASLIPRDLFDAMVGGRFKLDLDIKGQLLRPRILGEGTLTSGFFQPDDFPLTISDAALRLDFRDRAVVLTEGRGSANGGPFNLSGRADLGDGFKLSKAKLEAGFKGLRLNYPPGLITVSEGSGRLEGDGRTWTISGDVRVVQGSFREDVYPGAELLGFSSLPLIQTRVETPAYYHDFKLDLGVSTTGPFLVRNNMADLGLEANLRVGGTIAMPLLSGRVQNTAVGEVVFGERRYTVETARVEFLGKGTVSPDVDIVAHTQLRHRMEDLDVRLRISGTAPELSYDLTSFPPRSREELSLLILTGKGLDEIRGSAVNTLGSQMILYFASPLASPVAAGIRKLLRVDDVTIEPLNIASEADPGARLTFSKKVSARASLTYSLDISRSQRQTWLVDYNLIRNFSLRGFRKDDGSYGGSLKHSFSLGGPPPLGDEARLSGAKPRLLTEVSIAGDPRLPQARLEKAWAPLRADSVFRVSDIGLAVDALTRLYKHEGYANVSVTPEIRESGPDGTAVLFRIEAGDPVAFVFRGDGISRRLKNRIRDAWTGKLPEASNLGEARRIILESLRRGRYYAADVEAAAVRSPGATTYTFSVARNGRYTIGRFEVLGRASVPEKVIRKAASQVPLSGSRGLWNLVNQPRLAVRSVKRALLDRGFTKAAVEPPRIIEDKERRLIDIVLPVEAGPLSRVRSVAFIGNSLFGPEELRRVLRLIEGRPFAPDRLPEDKTALHNLDRGRGFASTEIDAAAIPAGGDDLDLVFTIKEGTRHIAADFDVRGLVRTSRSFVLKTFGLKAGEPLSLDRLALGQKRLYDTGAFAGVSVFSLPPTGPETGENRTETVVIEVREAPPLAATYGVRYNSEEKFEGFGEIGIRNLFGAGRSGLASYRQNARQRDMRLSFQSPSLFGLRLNLLSAFYSKRDIREYFTTDETGLTLQSSLRLPLQFSLSALYRLNKIHTFEPVPLGPFPFDISLFLSEVGAVLVRDTRDDLLDPRRGSFLSLALIYSPEFLGTELPYISAFGQFALNLSFGPGLVWASGLRVGLADAYDQVLIPSRRFYAGGGNSIRGFRQDRVGPIDPYLDMPEGGEAVLIFNQELRFPLLKPVSGAVFYDAGNVYPTVRDIRISEFRHSLGLGLRIAGPLGLLRVDYGFNLAPRPGESRGVFTISIGQA